MWYASCSSGAHSMTPSILVPGAVVDAGASSGPCSSGIVSGPGLVPLAAVVEAALLLAAALEVVVEVLVLPLEPQPATSAAEASRDAKIDVRLGMGREGSGISYAAS